MKSHKIEYVIYDPVNKSFWQRTNHCAGVSVDGVVLGATFVNKLIDAASLTKQEARKTLYALQTKPLIISGATADINKCVIKKVCHTIEMQLRPRYFPSGRMSW